MRRGGGETRTWYVISTSSMTVLGTWMVTSRDSHVVCTGEARASECSGEAHRVRMGRGKPLGETACGKEMTGQCTPFTGQCTPFFWWARMVLGLSSQDLGVVWHVRSKTDGARERREEGGGGLWVRERR